MVASIVLLLICATVARGQFPAPTYRPAAPRYRPTAFQPRSERSTADLLDELEHDVFVVATGEADAKNLPRIEDEANRLLNRPTATESERSRAQFVLRRVNRLRWRKDAAQAPKGLSSVTPDAAPAGGAFEFPMSEIRNDEFRKNEFRGNLVSRTQYVSPMEPSGVITPAQTVVASPPQEVITPPSVIAPPPPGFTAMPYPPGPDAAFMGGPPLPMPTFVSYPRHYISLDALLWFVQTDHLPALVTTSPIGTPQNEAGVLGLSSTTVLFGNQSVNGQMRPGGRVQGGVWLDPLQTVAVEGHYYALATASTNYFASGTFAPGPSGGPILARPFFDDNPTVNAQSSALVAYPNFQLPPFFDLRPFVLNGSIQIRESSNLQSAGAGGRFGLNAPDAQVRWTGWAGWRYFNMNETLSILATSTAGSNPFPFPLPPGRIESFDNFATRNVFNGGEFGLAANWLMRRFVLSADTRVALGGMFQSLDIYGRTSAISRGYVASYPGGLLAQPTNIGHYTRTVFAVIPQIDLKLGYQLLPSLRMNVGYNFTYISNVLRPGNQIDTTVNSSQIADLPVDGPHRPAASFNGSGVWLQGVTLGFDLMF